MQLCCAIVVMKATLESFVRLTDAYVSVVGYRRIQKGYHFFFLNQQFFTRDSVVGRGSYTVVTQGHYLS